MPAKAPLDENVKFLYSCLIRSDYKTIDFSRVAADFAINPAAARMRWSRLKKSINPDDMWSQPILEALPKKVKKKKAPPKVPKEETEEREEKLIKDEVKELELEDAVKDKSTPEDKSPPRKAKLKAGKKIGVVIKDERRSDVDDDGEAEITSGDKGEDEDMFRMPETENEQPAVELAATTEAAAPQRGLIKVEKEDDVTQTQPTQESTQKEKTPPRDTSPPPFNMFPTPPEPSILSKPPVTQAFNPVSLPEIKGDGHDEDEGWGATIVVKHETNPDPKISTKRKFSTTLGSVVSSFSPPSSAHSSPSPPQAPRKSERTPGQRWHAIVSRSRQTRSKSRKIYSEENEVDNEDEQFSL